MWVHASRYIDLLTKYKQASLYENNRHKRISEHRNGSICAPAYSDQLSVFINGTFEQGHNKTNRVTYTHSEDADGSLMLVSLHIRTIFSQHFLYWIPHVQKFVSCSQSGSTAFSRHQREEKMRNKYSRLSLSRIQRDSLKYFEISVPRHIRFAELRKK